MGLYSLLFFISYFIFIVHFTTISSVQFTTRTQREGNLFLLQSIMGFWIKKKKKS